MAEKKADTVMVKPVRRYDDENEGYKTPESKPYKVDRRRAEELKRNGLVTFDGDDKAAAADDDAADTKVAPEPENKMAPETSNKRAGRKAQAEE